jgi:hypothetical protein
MGYDEAWLGCTQLGTAHKWRQLGTRGDQCCTGHASDMWRRSSCENQEAEIAAKAQTNSQEATMLSLRKESY